MQVFPLTLDCGLEHGLSGAVRQVHSLDFVVSPCSVALEKPKTILRQRMHNLKKPKTTKNMKRLKTMQGSPKQRKTKKRKTTQKSPKQVHNFPKTMQRPVRKENSSGKTKDKL